MDVEKENLSTTFQEQVMNIFKSAAIASVLALSSVVPAHAAVVTAGGVTWDTDWADGGEVDFTAQFDFTQWYSAAGAGSAMPGVITNYDSAVLISTVLGALNPAAGAVATGYTLQGTGEIYRVNGSTPGVELTLAFGGIGLNKDSTFDISGAWAKIFADNTPDYSHPLSNNGEVAAALDGAEWLNLDITSLGFQSGTVGNGVVSASFEIIDGLAASFFNPKTLRYTADAGFFTNLGAPLAYSTGGNGSAYGDTNLVPEPGSLALLGAGLFGIAALRRRSA